MKEIKTGLEKNKDYTVDFCVDGEAYTTHIFTTSQKMAKTILKEMIPDATNVIAKHYAKY